MMKSTDLNGLLSMLMTFVVFVTSMDPAQFVDYGGQGIKKDVVAVGQIFAETISTVGFSQCSNVKKLLGVSYKELDAAGEPDLNELSLVYRTRSLTYTFNISSSVDSLEEIGAFQHLEKLVIFIHGFLTDTSGQSTTDISESFLQSDEGDRITLLALDSSPYIRFLYLRASTFVTFIGQRLGALLATLVRRGLDPSQIHLVGHSLGAHISGFTGKQFYKLTGKKIGRISGLDPAGPCFSEVNTDCRLCASDADYVDVIHSDKGVLGINSPVGHVDYYPNGGEQQTGCFLIPCSHERSVALFGVSVMKKDSFPAVRCDSWEAFTKDQCYDEISYMGYASRPGTTGMFYLQTGGKYPYGLGLDGIKYKNNVGLVRNVQAIIEDSPVVKKLT